MKKLLSWLLILCMVISIVPVSVFAAEETEVTSVGNVAKVGNTEYATIDEAIAAWTNNTTLTLLADVTLSDVIKLSSTEYHILDLGTYTMTAASGKDAIQIENNGRSSASYALDIKADSTNPGGIIATGKAIVRTAGKSGVKDRPIIRFYNGVFNASYIVYHSGSNGTNCPQFQFHGGVFNGTVYTNRALNQFYGGTFNGNLQMSVDSSAYTLVAGGTFKQLSNLYMSSLNSDKFTIGSTKGVYDKEVYIDDNGNYVIAAAEPAQGIEAAVAKNPGTNDYLKYSKVATEGKLNYTDAARAIKDNKSATITVYADELDMSGITNFTGTIVVPEGHTLTIANAPEGLNVEGDGDVVYALNGSGTETDPYQIGSLEDLITFRDSVNAGETKYNAPGVYVVLTDDIDMEDTDWSVNIGDDCNATFDGIFDGQNHTIYNLTSTETAQKADGYICTGLFGAIYGDAVVKNLTIENVTIDTGDFTGNNVAAVVGFAYSATGSVENVTVQGNIQINANKVDGVGVIVGYAYGGTLTVKDCTVDGTAVTRSASSVNGQAYVGGVIGYAGGKATLDNNTVNNIAVNASSCAAGGVAGIMLGGSVASGNTVKNVTLTSAHENWQNAVGAVAGTFTGAITVENTTTENNNTDALVGVLHANKPTTPLEKAQAKIGDVYYGTFAAAYAAAQAGDTITLLAPIVVNAGETLTLDKDVTISYTSNVAGEDMITNRGTLNIAAGKITYVNTDATGANVTVSTISCEPGSVLNITGGTVENKTVKADGSSIYSYAIDMLTNGSLGDVTAIISGGTVYSDYMAIRQFNNGTARKNTLVVNGGEIYGAKRAIQVHMDNNAAYTTISGGVIEAGEGGYALCFLTTSENIVVSGGEFKGAVWYSGTDGFISGGTFDEAVYEAYCAEGFIPTENADGTYEVVADPAFGKVAMIGDEYFDTLQAAIDACVIGDNTITLIADVDGDAKVTQKDGVNIVINGQGKTFTGVLTVFGNGRHAGTETLTIKNIVFQAVDGEDSCIVSPDRTVNNLYSYSHNVTVEGCNFKGSETDPLKAAAVRHEDGGDKNWTIKDCTVDANMHSLIQTNNVNGKLVIDNCEVYSKNGANLNSCTNVEIKNSTFDVKGYAVRTGVSSGGNLGEAKTFVFENNTLKSACDGGDAVIMFRKSAVDANLTMTENVVSGTTHISGNTDETTINADANYWDGKNAPVVSGTTVEVNTYYKDEALTELAKNNLDGSGTEDDPYVIKTKDDMFLFASKVNDGTYKNVYVVLGANIDLEQEDWTSIGTSANPFTGTFDGQGYTIYNIWSYDRGLFGYTSTGNYVDSATDGRATIKNLTIEGVEVYNQSTSAVGGLVGQAGQNTEISNVKVTGYISIYGYGYVGALVGQGYVHVDNCDVIGVDNESGDRSTVDASYWSVGGIVGHAGSEGGASITNCHVENIDIVSAIYGAGSILGVGTSGPIENVTAKDVNVIAASTDDANGALVGCNYDKVTGDSWAKNVNVTVGGSAVSQPQDMVAEVDGTLYSDLFVAVEAANAGDTVKLLNDVSLTSTLTINADDEIILDLNGKTITGVPAEAKAYAVINNKGNLTITGNGAILCDHKLAGSTAYAVNTILNSGALTINGAKIENKSTATSQIGYAIDNNSTTGNAILVIKDGEVKASGSNYYDGIRLFCNSTTLENSVTVEGGKVSSIWLQNPSDGADRNTKDVKGNVTISGGEVAALYLEPSAAFTADISGGKIGSVSYFETSEGRDVTKFVSGGIFDNPVPEDFCKEGFIPTENADGTYGVKEGAYVAQIGDVKYESFEAAYKASKAGDTIVLLKTAVIDGMIVSYSSKAVTVKAEGLDTAFLISDKAMMVTFGSMTVESDGACITVGVDPNAYGPTVNIYGGTYNGGTSAITAVNGLLTIHNGTFSADDAANTVTSDKKFVSVKGGTFANFDPSEYLVAKYAAVKDSENNWGVVPAVASIGNKYYATLADAFAAAQDGDEVKILAAGTYALTTSGKNITITGAVDGVVFDNIGAFNMGSANVIFNNVTFDYYPNVNYTGLQHSGNLVYNDCTFDGQVFLYGVSETFNNCTFNQNSADAYNVWTYGAKKVDFNECTFNSAGKSVLVYSEDKNLVNDVTVTDSDFIASAPVDGKAAIEIDTSLTAGANITIDADTTTTGFGTGNVSLNSLWNNKKGSNTDANNDITITVGDKVVLAPVKFAAYIGTTGYTSISDAIKAAQAGDTVTIVAGDYITDISVNKAITVVGETDDQGNNLVNITGKLNITADGAAVKNINVNNGSSSAGYINAKDVLVEGCTIVGGNGFRYCYTTGTVTFKDSTITGSTYGIHFDGSTDGNIVIDNCVITGWTSFASAIENVTISNTEFADGNYDYLRFYQDAELTNVKFNPNMTVDFAATGVTANFTGCTVTDGSDLIGILNKDDLCGQNTVTINGEKIAYVARIGNDYYETLEEALADVKDYANIKLVANATLDYGARDVYGRDTTEEIIIDGQGHTLTLNQTNSDWSSIGLKSEAGKLTLKNMTIEKTGYGDTSGAWNTHAIIFSSELEMTDVTVNNAIAVQDGATLNNVTINEANGYYGLWINGNGQKVTVNGGAINATNGGRGIKIADQYIDAPASVSLTVDGTVFNTAKKAAVLVSSTAGADITASNVDITNVAEDSVNFVWVDEDWAADYGEVTVTGVTKAQESPEKFTVAIVDANGEVLGYYKTLQAAINACVAGDNYITLLANNAENVTIKQTEGVNVVIDGNGKNYSGTITIHGNARYKGAETLTFKNINFVTDKAGHYFIDSNSTGSVERYAHNVTVEDCTFTATGAAVDTAVAMRIRQGFDIEMKSCIVENLHSAFQGYGCAGFTAQNVTVDGCKNGFSVGTSTNAVIKNCTIEATGYGVRADGTVDATLTVENCTITANLPVVVRDVVETKNYTVTVNGGTLTGTNDEAYAVIFTKGDDGTYEAPTSGFTANIAADVKCFPVYDYVAQVGAKKYVSLADAIAAAQSGDTITILADFALTAPVTVGADKKITLDLNGKTISYTSDVAGEAMITNKGDLTIDGDGKIVYTYTGAADASYGKGNYTISNGGTLTLNSGVVENATAAMSHASYAIDNNSTGAVATVTINDGKVLNTNNYAIRQFVNGNKNVVNVNGGEITGTRAIWLQLPGGDASKAPEAQINVTAGILTGTKVDSSDNKLAIYSYSYGNDMENVSINISGGEFYGDVALTGGANKNNIETLNISGGEFYGYWGDVYSYGDDAKAAEAITITGGTFKTNAAEMYALDDGYEFTKNADGTYSAFEIPSFNKVAQIGDKYYATLAAAIAAAQAGDTITLLADVTENVTVNKNITIDGAGFNYTGTMTIANGKTVTVQNVNFVKGCIDKAKGTSGTLTVTNCNFDGVDGSINYAVTMRGGNTVVMDDCTVKNYSYGMLYVPSAVANVTVTDTTVDGMNYGVHVAYGNKIDLENVTMNGTAYGIMVQNYGAKTLTIKGCKIDATYPVYVWERNTTVVETVVFEGDNEIASLAANNQAEYILDANATLKAPAGIVDTTNAGDNYKVVYENGTYSVVAKDYVAQIGETKYESLQEAINAAQNGDTITLLADVTENVTVGKSITIDGANFKYTGGISVKGNANSTAVTVKNVNFVGGTANYAITTNTIKSITVENCTASNYDYGFLYANRTTTNVVVKNVTVDGGNYGIHWVYGTTATLENVEMTNVTYGLYIQNYAGKTINLKNCSISSIAIWERSGYSGVQTFKFEGNNTVGTLTDSQYAKYVLAEVGATLAAPADANVTTNVADHKVEYVNGTYVVVEKNYVAQIGETKYESLQEAINAAQDGDVVTLIKDINIADVEIQTLDGKYNTYYLVEGKKITVDLNGKTISGAYTGDSMLVGVFSTDNGGHLTLTGNGTVDVTATKTVYSLIANYEEGCKIVIENGTYKLDKASDSLIYSGVGSDERPDGSQGVVVKGGSFYLGNVGTGDNGSPWIFNAVGKNNNDVYVIGGTYNADVNNQHWAHEVFIPETYYCQNNGDGTWTVKDGANAYVTEMVGGYAREVGYATLADAVAAAKDGETVTVIADHELVCNKNPLITVNNDITINFNGKVVTADVIDSDPEAYFIFKTSDDAKLTISAESGNGGVVINNGEDITAYMFCNNGEMEINGGKFILTALNGGAMFFSENSNMVINGGTFYQYTNGWMFNTRGNGVYAITVNGGTFNRNFLAGENATPAENTWGEAVLHEGYCLAPNSAIAGTWIVKTSHKVVIDAAVEATCTTTGLTEGSHCSACGEVLVAQTVVDALGHTEGAAVVENNVDPDCTTHGTYDSVV